MASIVLPGMTVNNDLKSKLKEGVTSLIYGVPGIGKTHMINFLPDVKTCYIGIEGGDEPLFGKNIPIINLELPKNEIGLKTFKDLVDGIRNNSTINGIDFSKIIHIVLDNISELERFFQFGLMKARKKNFLSIKEYGDTNSKMKEYLRYFRDLKFQGKYVTLIAHEMLIEEDDELGVRVTKTYPQISQRMVREIMGMYDIVGRMEKEYSPDNPSDFKRVIRIEPDMKVGAKCRIPGYVQLYGTTIPQDISQMYKNIYMLRKQKIEEK